MWIGPARRHALKGAGDEPRSLFGRLGHGLTIGFTPLAPLYRVEHAFARLGTWRRLSRCYEGSPESARAWLEVACVGYLFGRLRVEPT